MATLVERSSRYLIILGLPEGRQAAGLADVLIDRVHDLPALMRGALTWDQGTEMARHAQLTVATDLPVYFAHPHSSWERGTNENTNRLIREYLPKGIEITSHQPYLNAIDDELGRPATRNTRVPHTTGSLHQTTHRQRCFHQLTPTPSAAGVE